MCLERQQFGAHSAWSPVERHLANGLDDVRVGFGVTMALKDDEACAPILLRFPARGRCLSRNPCHATALMWQHVYHIPVISLKTKKSDNQVDGGEHAKLDLAKIHHVKTSAHQSTLTAYQEDPLSRTEKRTCVV